jgi:hypothetical protein
MPITNILDGTITTILEVPIITINFIQLGILAHLNTIERLDVGSTNVIVIAFLVANGNSTFFT